MVAIVPARGGHRPRALPQHQAAGRLPAAGPHARRRPRQPLRGPRGGLHRRRAGGRGGARARRARSRSCARRELAADLPSLKPVIAHAVRELEAAGEPLDVVVVLQATTPFRDASAIDEAVDRLLAGGYDTVVSVTEDRTLNWREEDGRARAALRRGRAGARSRPRSTRRTARWWPCGARPSTAPSRFGDKVGYAGPRQARRLHRLRPRGLLDGGAAAAPAARPLPRGRRRADGHGPRLPLAGHRGGAARAEPRRHRVPDERGPHGGPRHRLPRRLPAARGRATARRRRTSSTSATSRPPSSSTTCPRWTGRT